MEKLKDRVIFNINPTREIAITIAGHRYDCELEDERERAANLAARAANKGGGLLKAVMPGVVVEVLVQAGEAVTEGQPHGNIGWWM